MQNPQFLCLFVLRHIEVWQDVLHNYGQKIDKYTINVLLKYTLTRNLATFDRVTSFFKKHE